MTSRETRPASPITRLAASTLLFALLAAPPCWAQANAASSARPAPRTDPNSRLAHEQLLEKAKRGRIDVYFVGDSITRRWGATDPRYAHLLANWRANFFGWNAANFGWGADRTENILWRLENGELDGVNPKVIVILAGTNNLGGPAPADAMVADVTAGVRAIVETCRRKAPNATMILTAIFPRNDNMALMPVITRINTNLAQLADGGKVRFLNVNDRLADADGKLLPGMMDPDKLHPAVKAYQIWADGLKPILTQLLGPPAATDQAPPPTGDPSATARPATSRASTPPGHTISGLPANHVAGPLVQLNDNGAWSWFMDPRAIVFNNKLVVGSVRAVASFASGKDDPNWGNVEVAAYDLATGHARHVVLHPRFEQDDHDGPAFLPTRDNRLLALYTRHGVDRKVYYRLSEPNDPLTWSDAKEFDSPGQPSAFLKGDNTTYANPFRFPDGKIYNFYRGFGYEPNYMVSDDDGRSWRYAGHFLKGRGGYAPYLKYAFDETDGTLHFIATEDHPRAFNNSIYHGLVKNGQICTSDGKPLAKLSTTTDAPLHTWDVTQVFKGDPDNVGWVIDVKLDKAKRPYVAFSVQKDGRGLPMGQGGFDHRYHYARWDGATWHVHEMAYAGVRLYPTEDDYTGLVALDPKDPDTVYISTNAYPTTGAPLISAADNQRHYEIFRGRTTDSGKTWVWRPITANSTTDNLRPLVPHWADPRTALVWMRGTYTHNRGEWTTAVVAVILPPDPDR
jgi:lysophospholipase L1-like esterase